MEKKSGGLEDAVVLGGGDKMVLREVLREGVDCLHWAGFCVQ